MQDSVEKDPLHVQIDKDDPFLFLVGGIRHPPREGLDPPLLMQSTVLVSRMELQQAVCIGFWSALSSQASFTSTNQSYYEKGSNSQ